MLRFVFCMFVLSIFLKTIMSKSQIIYSLAFLCAAILNTSIALALKTEEQSFASLIKESYKYRYKNNDSAIFFKRETFFIFC